MLTRVKRGWSFETAREPATFGAGQLASAPGVEHAVVESGTLCGVPEQEVTSCLHLFEPEGRKACPECRRRANAAPTNPCAQERLHDKILAAVPGAARDDLLTALREGAKVRLWIRGPAASLARHYARLDTLTEGAEPAAEAFKAAATIGLARIEEGAWHFIAVLPEDGSRPLVARGPRTGSAQVTGRAGR